MEDLILSHKDIWEPKQYFLYKEEKSELLGRTTENKITADVSVQLSKNFVGEKIFIVSISNYKQTNVEGLYKWVQDLLPIRKKIIFTVSEDGSLGNIKNHGEINNTFKEIIPWVLKKHSAEKNIEFMGKELSILMNDAERLAKSWRYAQPYINLFAGIHGKSYNKEIEVQGYRELPSFIGIKELPIYTKEKLVKDGCRRDSNIEIEVEGVLAVDKIDQEKLSSFVRLLRDNPLAVSEITLKYNENHILNEYHWTVQSTCMSLVIIPGFLYRQETTAIKEI
jgi:hypothetical protein